MKNYFDKKEQKFKIFSKNPRNQIRAGDTRILNSPPCRLNYLYLTNINLTNFILLCKYNKLFLIKNHVFVFSSVF